MIGAKSTAEREAEAKRLITQAEAAAAAAANAQAISDLKTQLEVADAAATKAAADAATARAEDKAAAEKVAKEAADAAEKLRIQLGNGESATKLNARIADKTEGTDLSDGSGLVSSFMPKIISESLKGEGNYDPNWMSANKAAGAQQIEKLTTSGQLPSAKSNVTDKNGNAIGGVVNSQDNAAMQDLAAGGSTDPLGDLSSQVSDEVGLDTSLSGALRQTINGADGQNYEGGGGLLKFSQEGDAARVFGSSVNQVDGFTEAERFGDSNEFAKIDSTGADVKAVDSVVADTTAVNAEESTTLDLARFSENLGFASTEEARAAWAAMTPEAQAIFNSKENPSGATQILEAVFGLFIPGFGLLNKYMYNDNMTLQEKLDFATKTAITIAGNNLKDGSATGGGGNEVVDTGDGTGVDDETDGSDDATVVDSNTVEYSSLESYLTLFKNFKF